MCVGSCGSGEEEERDEKLFVRAKILCLPAALMLWIAVRMCWSYVPPSLIMRPNSWGMTSGQWVGASVMYFWDSYISAVYVQFLRKLGAFYRNV